MFLCVHMPDITNYEFNYKLIESLITDAKSSRITLITDSKVKKDYNLEVIAKKLLLPIETS